MFSIQVWRGNSIDKELHLRVLAWPYLTAICIRTRICLLMNEKEKNYHCQITGLVKLDLKAFIFKVIAVNTYASCPISLIFRIE